MKLRNIENNSEKTPKNFGNAVGGLVMASGWWRHASKMNRVVDAWRQWRILDGVVSLHYVLILIAAQIQTIFWIIFNFPLHVDSKYIQNFYFPNEYSLRCNMCQNVSTFCHDMPKYHDTNLFFASPIYNTRMTCTLFQEIIFPLNSSAIIKINQLP